MQFFAYFTFPTTEKLGTGSKPIFLNLHNFFPQA